MRYGVLLSALFLLSTQTSGAVRKRGRAEAPARKIHYTLPKLEYAYTALEPYLDAQTLRIHYTKHHQKYVDTLNETLKEYPHIAQIPLETLLTDPRKIPVAIRKKVIDNGGGHYNHSFFWVCMAPLSTPEPGPLVKALIEKQFSTFEKFKTEFSQAAEKVFGSGWAWLVLKKDGSCAIITTANQDTPISLGYAPLLCLDVWEHAYYLKFQNKRRDFIDAWWNVVNWDHVEQCYRKIQGSQSPPKV